MGHHLDHQLSDDVGLVRAVATRDLATSSRWLIRRLNGHRASSDLARLEGVKQQLIAAHLTYVRRCVAGKVPPFAVEDVTAICVESALRSKFNGTTEAELRAWLRRIASRRVVDYYRHRDTCVSLEALGDSVAEAADDLLDAANTGAVIGQQVLCLGVKHREVVLRYLVAGEPAGDITRAVPGMTVNNVHKIVERFRKNARAALDAEAPHVR